MPKRTTRRQSNRPAPYSRSTRPTMTAAIISPIGGWAPHHHPSYSWSDPHMSAQYQNYQPMTQPYIPVSAPLPQPVQPQPSQSAPWTAEEDTRLMDAKHQGLAWNEIHQRHFPTKSGNACRKRHERLQQKLRTTDWNESRIRRVLEAYNEAGVRERFWNDVAIRSGEQHWQDVERVVCAHASNNKGDLSLTSD